MAIASVDYVLCAACNRFRPATPFVLRCCPCRYPIFRGKTVTGSKSTIKEAGRMKVLAAGDCRRPCISLYHQLRA